MFRFVIITVLIGVALALPLSETQKNLKKGKYFKHDGLFGGDQTVKPIEYSESAHVKNAPQDPNEQAEQVPNDLYHNNNQHNQHIQHNQQNQHIQHNNRPNKTPFKIDYDELNNHQAQSAHYSFDSSIQDNINDQSHVRQETRDGLKVTGMYSYSDGFFQRTVHYIADENGYRVVKEDVKKIGEGPQFNSGGQADVKSSLIGGYSIQIDDRERNPHYVGIQQPK